MISSKKDAFIIAFQSPKNHPQKRACVLFEGLVYFVPFFERANLAQLAELHLAKVEVEGSSPLVRSILKGV